MQIKHLEECSTTAGAVATVAQPFETVQKREPEKKLKGSNLLKGIKTSGKYANSLHEGEGFPHDVDHMPGQTMKHQDTNCTACHGRKVQYKLGDKLHADNKKGATKVRCQTCNGTGDKEHTDTEDGRNYANAFGTYRYDESVEEGAKVDRMVGHVKSSEKKLGKSSKEAENIAWATANKRGMLDNKNKEQGVAEASEKDIEHGATKFRYTGGMHGEYQPTLSQASAEGHAGAADYHRKQIAIYKRAMDQHLAKDNNTDAQWCHNLMKHHEKMLAHHEGATQGVAEGADSTWHGSNSDMGWYDAYKDQPVRVKVKNHSGLGSNPAGTFIVRSFKKIDATKAELTITSRGNEMTGEIDLDNPATVVTKNYDRVPAMDFYSGNMPITPRQAFNLFQHKNKQQGVVDEANIQPAGQADPAMPAPVEEPESDPELRSAEQDANIHYADAAKRKKSIEKFLLRSVKHAKEADTQQNLEIRKIKRDMDAIRQMAKAPVAEGEITEDDVVLSADRRKPKSGLLSKPEPTTNPADVVKVDVPLLIRLLEFAKEDAADDMALHDLAEKLVAGCQRGRTLTMKDYDNLVPSKQPEAPAPDEEEPEDFEGKFNQEMDEEQAVLTKPEWLSKRKALQDIQMDPDVSKNPQLKRELMLKIAALKKRAEAAGLTEEELDEISEPTVKSYMKGAMRDTISGKKDRNPGIKRAVSRLAGTNKPLIQPK